MMRRTPMKRGPWKRLPHTNSKPLKTEEKEPVSLMECAQVAIKSIVRVGAKMARIGGIPHTERPKDDAVRSEEYRRLVAKMPCIACGVHDYSQAAHPPPTGKGIKEDDRECFPLCSTRVLVPGCHYEFDQYQMFPKNRMRVMADLWGAQTRRRIKQAGAWPKALPDFETNQPAALDISASAATN